MRAKRTVIVKKRIKEGEDSATMRKTRLRNQAKD